MLPCLKCEMKAVELTSSISYALWCSNAWRESNCRRRKFQRDSAGFFRLTDFDFRFGFLDRPLIISTAAGTLRFAQSHWREDQNQMLPLLFNESYLDNCKIGVQIFHAPCLQTMRFLWVTMFHSPWQSADVLLQLQRPTLPFFRPSTPAQIPHPPSNHQPAFDSHLSRTRPIASTQATYRILLAEERAYDCSRELLHGATFRLPKEK